jgi:hypothetical protein
MKTLENTYCVPKLNEWNMNLLKHRNPFNGMDICGKGSFNRNDRTEISVQQFIDLVEDRIVQWRLVEDGFENKYAFDYVYKVGVHTDLYITPNYYFIRGRYNSDEVDIYVNLKTYSDLLTLIRLLK